MLRFTRVVFGVSASPFLLNATINHHMKKLESADHHFVDKFCRSICVDDVATGAADVEGAYEFYLKAKLHLAKASFNLRKFESNSPDLCQRIKENEQGAHKVKGVNPQHHSLAAPDQASTKTQVLGVTWDTANDRLLFDISDISRLMRESCSTKRNVISLATRFYDPLEVISPITVRFKQLFQRLCEGSLDWDEPLKGELLAEWESLTSDLQQFTPLQIPRCYLPMSDGRSTYSFSLRGYCDASKGAYAAVVYIQVEGDDVISSQFLCSKTRVAPVKKTTIPRLELLSALLLARLISTIRCALEPEIQLRSITCHTDSLVTFFWITRREREWKQFVQNRVNEICELIPPDSWRHCPGTENPADIPSRGVSPRELQEKLDLWLHGPPILQCVEVPGEVMTMPEDCFTEMKMKDKEKLTLSLLSSGPPATILPCEDYSSLKKLLRVTAYVLKFVTNIKNPESNTTTQARSVLNSEDVHLALIYWLKASQVTMPEMKNFQQWSGQLASFRTILVSHWRIQKLREGGARPHALAQSGQATPTMHVVNFDPSVRRCGIASPSCRGDGVAA